MKKIVLFALAACILAACTPKEFAGTETPSAARKIFKAGIENTTRTYVDGLNVCWAEDDAISIFDFNSANSKYVYAGTPGETNGLFEYDSDPGAGSDIDAIYAVYPYSENHIFGIDTGVETFADDDWLIYFSQIQEYAPGSFGPGANVMVAKSQTESLMFKNACGYLKLNLYSLNGSAPVSYIEIKGNNSETISGYGVVTASEDSDPSVSMLSDYGYQNVYIYDPSGNLALSSAALFPTEIWIALPPTTFRRGITLTIYNENGDRFVKSTTKKLEIKRGTVKSTNALNVQYESLASESEVAEKLEGAYEGVLTTYFEEDPITDTLYFQALPDDYHADYGNVYITGSLAGLYFSYALGNMYGD
ncbi:MAG: hypothetical protein J5764_04170, partial [Bacteroidales bacterium]|nr:hypothetical protein [Bacteroidales bacterium]